MDFRALGALEVLDAARPVPLGGTKQRAVLALLLLRSGAVVPADALAEAVWGERVPARHRAVLQVYVATLRTALEPDRGRGTASTRISTCADGYRLRVWPGESDVDRFWALLEPPAGEEPAAARAARLLRAEELWRGPAFPDLRGGAPPPELVRLDEARLAAHEARLDAELACGRHARVAAELAGLVLEHPLRERLRELQVLALYRSGRQAEALGAYRAAREHLVDELGVEPGAAMQALERAVLRQDPALDLPAPAPERAVLPGRLPVPVTSLVGREQDRAEVEALLRSPAVRLLTLHGPGGAGKTRLAVAAAAAVADAYPGGVALVPLAGLSDASAVLPAVAVAAGVPLTASATVADLLVDRLGDRRLLLVLDNLEQVAGVGPVVAGLLAAVPGLTVLTTSRAALRVAGERVHEVSPLTDAAAQALLVERARAACPGLALDEASTADLAAVCRRLDALPLAIELAAARLRLLSPADLLARLDRRLPLLTGGCRDLPARQRTLRATLAWSHELLPPPEQRLFARMAVLDGRSTLSTLEQVCGDELGGDVLDLLQELVDSSLVQVARGEDEPRLTMMQTVREYAGERLAALPEAPDVHRRHAQVHLALVELLETDLTGSGQAAAVRRLEAEQDNLRGALRWALASGAGDLALRLAGALAHFWEMTARFAEGRDWLAAVLALEAAGSAPARAKALTGAGTLAFRQGDGDAALRHHREALALYRALGDEAGTVFALNNVAVQHAERAEHDLAQALFEEVLRRADDPRTRAVAHGNLGELALARGHPDRAGALHERALEEYLAVQDDWGIAVSSYNVGSCRLHHGEPGRAAGHLAAGLARAHALGDRSLVAVLLEGLACVEARTGSGATAARLLGAGAALHRETGAPGPAQDLPLVEDARARARAALGPAAYAQEEAAGSAWALDEAVAAAAPRGRSVRTRTA